MIPALVGMVLLTSCGGDEEEDPEPTTPDECANATFPSTTGDGTINILNYSSSSVSVAAGDVLSLAIEVKKGTNRTKKLRIYQTDCANSKGTQVKFDGQPKVDNDGTIDLRNTTEQVRNINYTVPTGMPTIYFNIELEEAGGKYSYKRLTLNVSGSGVISTWELVDLGGNLNALASRMSSGTGLTYVSCDAGENMDYIDITYAVSTVAPTYYSYICSNPARFNSPVSLTSSTATNCDSLGTSISTAGGNAAYFVAVTGNADSVFTNATDASLSALTVSSSDPQFVQVTALGEVFAFLNNDGKKGLIKVKGIDATYGLNDGRGSITVDVKVQR